jgi:AraC-like DNA-binding protein
LDELTVSDDIRVFSILLRALSEALQQAEHDSSTLFARSNIDFHEAEARGWVTLSQFDGLLQNAVALTGDPAFGLHWAERSPMFQLDLAMSYISAAPTLRDALRALLQLQLLFVDREQCWFVETGRRPTISLDLLAVSDTGRRVMTDLALGGMMRLFRYRGDERAIRRINVAHPKPTPGAEYDRMFGSLVRFDQPRFSFELSSAALDRRHALSNEERFRAIRDYAAALRQQVLGQLSYAEQLEGHIRTSMPRILTMAEAAAAMDTSERSLRRWLAQEGLSYTELVDNVQRTRARELLRIGNKSIKEVAVAVGFAHSSGFVRAYRRWTGESPGSQRAPASQRGRR